MLRYEETEKLYAALAERAQFLNHLNFMARAFHQLGIIAQARRDFPGAADFYLKSLKIFADANDPHSLMVVIRSYARLLHNAEDTERIRLRKAWAMYMDEKLTAILEQMETEIYGTNS